MQRPSVECKTAKMFVHSIEKFVQFFLLFSVFIQDSRVNCEAGDIDGKVEVIECTIPNEAKKGFCTFSENCPTYIDLFNSSTLERFSFIKQLNCEEVSTKTLICCPVDGKYLTPEVIVNGTLNQKANDYLSSRFGENSVLEDACGAIPYDQKIKGGELAGIDEFPWTALLLYRRENSQDLNSACGGVLISELYTLSAAHCLSSKTMKSKGPLTYVRLGEYDLTRDPDCIQESTDEFVCAPKPQDIAVATITIHPDYEVNSISKHNDIGIVKLAERAKFTDYVQPICMPTNNQLSEIAGNKLFISGWGLTDRFSKKKPTMLLPSPIKLKLQIPFVNFIDCAKKFIPMRLRISPTQICAGGVRDKDACAGDSGSPLMTLDMDRQRWVLTGIVSFGLKICGSIEGVPGIYTNVFDYLEWINAQMSK